MEEVVIVGVVVGVVVQMQQEEKFKRPVQKAKEAKRTVAQENEVESSQKKYNLQNICDSCSCRNINMNYYNDYLCFHFQ